MLVLVPALAGVGKCESGGAGGWGGGGLAWGRGEQLDLEGVGSLRVPDSELCNYGFPFLSSFFSSLPFASLLSLSSFLFLSFQRPWIFLQVSGNSSSC